MRYITTSHLKTWAPERSCQDHLPLILRRLIYASPVTVKSIRFPAGSLIGLPGFDGQLEIEGIFPHIPNERSVWEIGTEKRHQDKATEDIKKRSNRAPSAEQKKLTYVFVTPYVWPKKDDWITKKMAVTNWKSIKVIDGEELEEWLEKLPSVGAFLAKYLGLPQGDVLPLDDFWHQWRQNENYTIPGSLITYGRESYVGKVTKVLTDSPNQGSYRLQSQEEALAFMAACIDKMDEPAKEKTFSRAVIVKDEDCFRRLSETKSPLILISTFPLDKLAAKALSNGHHVLEPLSAEYTVRHRDDIIDIPVVHRVGFEKALTEMGLSSEKVQKVIKNSGLSLSVLRRQLQFEQGIQPTWAKSDSFAIIIPAMLAGKWDEANETDREFLSQLAGESYEIYQRKLAAWKIQPDAPVLQIRSFWRTVSPIDAWSVLSTYVSKLNLEKFGQLFLSAFNSDVSRSLKEGLLESLIMIAVYGDTFNLEVIGGPQSYADGLFWQLVKDANKERWQIIGTYLPLLAEISPSVFMNAVEESLEQPSPPLMVLFYNSSQYAHLLWALERLSLTAEYLVRVTKALAILARLSPPLQMRNTPINSLCQLYTGWYRQTAAPVSTMKLALKRIVATEPEIAWNVLMEIMPCYRPLCTPIDKFRWRHSEIELERNVPLSELLEFYSFIYEQCIALAKDADERLASIIRKYPYLMPMDREKVLEYLKGFSRSTKDFTLTRNELNEILFQHKQHADTDWALKGHEILKLEQLLELFPQMDLIERYVLLFDKGQYYPEKGIRLGSQEANENTDQRRLEAVNEIYRHSGIKGVFQFAEKIEHPALLGPILSRFALSEKDVAYVCGALTGPEKHKIASQSYLFEKSKKHGIHFVMEFWKLLKELEISQAGKLNFFLSLYPSLKCWEFMTVEASDLTHDYWAQSQIFLFHFPMEEKLYAINQLSIVNRHLCLIDQVSFFSQEVSSSSLIRILTNAATIRSIYNIELHNSQIQSIFEELRRRQDIDSETMIRLETIYLSHLTDNNADISSLALGNELASNPDYFVLMVSKGCLPDDEVLHNMSDEEKLQFFKDMKSPRKILENWHALPGIKHNGKIDKAAFEKWVIEVRQKAKAMRCIRGADGQLGELMARYPRNNDFWPAREICEMIELIDSKALVDHFETEIFNSRGITIRSVFDGGDQERVLADWFSNMGDKVMPEYPSVGAALKRLAKTYYSQGKEEDEAARLDMLR